MGLNSRCVLLLFFFSHIINFGTCWLRVFSCAKCRKEKKNLHGRGNPSGRANHNKSDAVCDIKRLTEYLEKHFGIWAVFYTMDEALGQGHPEGLWLWATHTRVGTLKTSGRKS